MGTVSSQPHVFSAVNRCIYCFRNSHEVGKALTDEHIIASGLNGNSILPKSSCPDCNVVTGEIERKFLQGSAWPIRTLLTFKSGHKRERPRGFELFITRGGKRESIWMPLDEYPVILPMPVFAPTPSGVTGPTHPDELFPRQIVMITLGTAHASELLLQIKQKYNADQVELPPLDVGNFARMIAKSAYALAVANLGLENARGNGIAQAILDPTQDIGRFIGSGFGPVIEPEQVQHITQVQTFTRPSSQEHMVVVLMKLFANMPAPGYIVGWVTPSEAGQISN
jgi:hypothetical protein